MTRLSPNHTHQTKARTSVAGSPRRIYLPLYEPLCKRHFDRQARGFHWKNVEQSVRIHKQAARSFAAEESNARRALLPTRRQPARAAKKQIVVTDSAAAATAPPPSVKLCAAAKRRVEEIHAKAMICCGDDGECLSEDGWVERVGEAVEREVVRLGRLEEWQSASHDHPGRKDPFEAQVKTPSSAGKLRRGGQKRTRDREEPQRRKRPKPVMGPSCEFGWKPWVCDDCQADDACFGNNEPCERRPGPWPEGTPLLGDECLVGEEGRLCSSRDGKLGGGEGLVAPVPDMQYHYKEDQTSMGETDLQWSWEGDGRIPGGRVVTVGALKFVVDVCDQVMLMVVSG